MMKLKQVTGSSIVMFETKDRIVANAPDCDRIYAIGDIHGRLDLLEALLDLIEKDRLSRPGLPESPIALVFLGDYIDRGPDSKGVIDRLLRGFAPPYTPVFLKGNHEKLLLSFLDDPLDAFSWIRNGGDAALLSYEVDADAVQSALQGDVKSMREAWRQFRQALPRSHLDFYNALKLCYRAGDYFFVHAGVRPGVPLDRQDEQDLLWIRHDFLLSKRNFGAVVVHGHTPALNPQDLPNRIGLDTIAVRSGKLTAVGLEGSRRWFLST